ncbi:hypothetical protein NADFUDRAFT_84062 [Nadsonia fulvescens var. elongata DSM 6958]|uniref:Uncharacterized protein n=1 Tax=Nadsonia fulvescens var. elongata DSM 6958 TaxID=857566 RepID=A0A1E3PF89_9ASCO|nr:hypothetical protein NADFUDRAFT_84062 [Nadsonia fulvescens var. elongata DSM 6958]
MSRLNDIRLPSQQTPDISSPKNPTIMHVFPTNFDFLERDSDKVTETKTATENCNSKKAKTILIV